MKVGLRKNTAVRFFAALLAAAVLAFSSCSNMGMDGKSFQNKVSSYFKEMTSTAAVSSFELDPASAPTDKHGNFCFPYDQECKVTLLLRNPQRYHFTAGSNMEFSMAGESGASPIWSDAISVLIEQDASDTSKIYVTYPSDFLRAHPLGDDISPVVRLYHPVSHASFGVYDKLKLSSNAPPPSPSGALVVQTNESTGGSKWVVCFKLPGSSAINSYHSDITSVSVNGNAFEPTITTGTISYPSGAALSSSVPSGITLAKNQVTGLEFTPESGTTQAQDAYFMTGDVVDQNQRVYTITVTDSAGLSSSVAVSARGFKLSAPDAFLVGDDTAFAKAAPDTASSAAKNTVGQDPNDGSAWITIRAEAKTAGGLTDGDGHAIDRYVYDPSNAYLVYELHRATPLDSSTLIRAGTLSGVSGNISVPAGTTYVKAFVRKPLYADSEPVVWNCRAVCTNLFVKESGSNADGEGSRAKPYRTIQKAVQQIQDGLDAGDYVPNTILNIRLLSDLTPPADFDWSATNDYFAKVEFASPPAGLVINIKGDGARRTINMSGNADKSAFGIKAQNVNIDNIDITGLESNSDAALIMDIRGSASVVYTNGSAYSNGGQAGSYISVASTASLGLKMQNVILRENHFDHDDGPGALNILNGAKVECYDCSFIKNSGNNQGAIYINSGASLTMERCSITGSRAPDGTGAAINNEGTCSLSNVTITGSVSSAMGAIYNTASLTLESCTITGNKADSGCAGVYNSGSSFTFTIKGGTTTIYDNLIPVAMGSAPTKQGNVYLPVGKKITVAGDLGSSKIGVNIPYINAEDKPAAGAPKAFTIGYGFDTTPPKNSKKPGLIFVAENGYGVTDKDGEAAFAVSGGAMYDPTDFKITTALDGAMAKPNVAKTFNVTISAYRKESGSFPATANLVYNLTDHKLYEVGGTVPATGEGSDNPAVTWTAALYNGGKKIASGASIAESGLTVTIPAEAMPQPDTYILKITATYMGYTHDASFTIDVTNRIGSLIAPSAVGDIVFNDGSAEHYSDALTLTNEQKNAAVAVIFYAGGDANLGNRILGVGLNQTTKAWAPNGTYGFNNGVGYDEWNASGNWSAIQTADPTGSSEANRATNYPAYAWCFSYGDTYSVAVNGETGGWYLPALAELMKLVIENRTSVSNSFAKIGSTALVDTATGAYWSSTSGNTYSPNEAKVVTKTNYTTRIKSVETTVYVRAIRQF